MAVTGVRETFAALHTLVDRELAQAAHQITAATIRRVYAGARARCPVSSPKDGPFPGHVRDQIRMQMAPDTPVGVVFVERRGIGGYYGTDNVGLWLEYGYRDTRTGRDVAPRPFLGPAAEVERGSYLALLRAATKRLTGRWR
jgi:hypothetical protein